MTENDPFGPHIGEGETTEDAEAKQQKLLREQLEVDLMQGSKETRKRLKRMTTLDD